MKKFAHGAAWYTVKSAAPWGNTTITIAYSLSLEWILALTKKAAAAFQDCREEKKKYIVGALEKKGKYASSEAWKKEEEETTGNGRKEEKIGSKESVSQPVCLSACQLVCPLGKPAGFFASKGYYVLDTAATSFAPTTLNVRTHARTHTHTRQLQK